MVDIRIDKSINRIVIKTDDPSTIFYLEFSRNEYKYIPWEKSWGYIKITDKIYDKKRKTTKNDCKIWTFELGLGWLAYIVNVFKDQISKETYDELVRSIYSDSAPSHNFPELRDYQNADLLHLLKFKIGNFTVHTGYGKTQVIATLTNYARLLNKRVLIVTPGKKAKDEVVKRCKKVFNIDIPNKDRSLNCLITSGLLNSKKFKDQNESKEFKDLLKTYDWVLVDEVEYTINDGGKYIYDNLMNCERFYGFSGSADKYSGKCISFANGIDDVILKNKELIKYFGPSLVYRMPVNIEINNISIKTQALNSIDYSLIDEQNGGIYNSIMTTIWTNDNVSKVVMKLIEKYNNLYIPINNLTSILKVWIEDYWRGVFRVLLVCGEGYIYYDKEGNITKLSLEQACDYIRDNKVDVIPSTSAGFRALDFPNLDSALIVSGNLAGQVLQQIGRVARGSEMNLITLEPLYKKSIPVYTKGMENRDAMIREYYKYCKINNILKLDSEL